MTSWPLPRLQRGVGNLAAPEHPALEHLPGTGVGVPADEEDGPVGVVVPGDALRAVVLDPQQHEGRVGHAGHLVEQPEPYVRATRADVVADGTVHLDAVADCLAARHPAFVPDHHGGGDDTDDGGPDGHDVLCAQPLHVSHSPSTTVRSPYGSGRKQPTYGK
jgi:hypothetical protein